MATAYALRSKSLTKGLQPDDVMTEETLELAEELRHRFKARDDLYKRIDAILAQETRVDIPQAYRKTALETRSPAAIRMSNTAVAALTVNPVTIQFRPIAFGDVAQQNATLREKFFEASWHRQEQEARRQLTRLFVYSLVTKGEAIFKTVERCNTAWSDYTDQAKAIEEELAAERELDQDAKDRLYNSRTETLKLKAPYPIATTDIPPETFYYEKNENGFTACLEIKQVPYGEALARFNTGLDRHGRVMNPKDWQDLDPRAMGLGRAEWQRTMDHTGGTLTVVEAWDWQVHCCILIGPGQGQGQGTSSSLGNGTLVRTIRHGYGDPVLKTLRGPYFQALGVTTDSRLPSRAGQGILFGYLDLFPMLDSLLTIEGNAAYMTGFPAFKRLTPPNVVPGLPATQQAGADAGFGSDGSEGPDEITLGTIYPYDVGPIDQPRSGQSFTAFLQNIQAMVDSAVPSVVQGIMSSADASGYALNQAAYLARIAWDPLVKNAQAAIGERTGFESWLIQHRIGEDVYAWAEEVPNRPTSRSRRNMGMSKSGWIAVGPDDLDNVHRYEAHLDISTPSDDVVKTRAIAEKLGLKLMTLEDAQREMGGNPDEIEASNLLQQMKAAPEIQSKLKDLIFQKLGTLQAQQIAQTPGMPSPQELMGGLQVPGQPPAGPSPGGIPGNPVPTPGMGLPIAAGAGSNIPIQQLPQGGTPPPPMPQGPPVPSSPTLPMRAPPPIVPGSR